MRATTVRRNMAGRFTNGDARVKPWISDTSGAGPPHRHRSGATNRPTPNASQRGRYDECPAPM